MHLAQTQIRLGIQSDQSLRSALNGQIRTQVFMWTATAQAGMSFRGHIILSRRIAFSTRLHGIKMTIETGHIISRAPIQSCKCSVNTQISLHHKIFYVRIALSLELWGQAIRSESSLSANGSIGFWWIYKQNDNAWRVFLDAKVDLGLFTVHISATCGSCVCLFTFIS